MILNFDDYWIVLIYFDICSYDGKKTPLKIVTKILLYALLPLFTNCVIKSLGF